MPPGANADGDPLHGQLRRRNPDVVQHDRVPRALQSAKPACERAIGERGFQRERPRRAAKFGHAGEQSASGFEFGVAPVVVRQGFSDFVRVQKRDFGR